MTETVKHTPGPWKLDHTTLEITTNDEIEAIIAAIDGDNCDWPQAEADARLIAAAPEMLGALRDLAEAARNACNAAQHPELISALFDADHIISKAEAQS